MDEIMFEYEIDAYRVLTVLLRQVALYGHVSLAKYYAACGLPSLVRNHRYGWNSTQIAAAEVLEKPGKMRWFINLSDPTFIRKTEDIR